MKHVWILMAGLVLAAPAARAETPAPMVKAGCMACHAVDKKLVGPSYQQVAAKYKGQDMAVKLMEKVRTGGKGVFGPIPMSPNGPDKISDADLRAAVEWILKQ